MMIQTKVDQKKLLQIMADIDAQPDWRSLANKACSYYDGDQLAPEVISILKERNQPRTTHNLIKPTINGVLGMEAKTRTDLLVTADDQDDEMEQLAEAINAEFSDVCRLARLDKARSDAYASQIKSGIGFVEVFRNPDLFGSKYKIKNVPRDEIFWDWLSTECDWSDARWVMRRRWIDTDELISLIPGKAEIIKNAANCWHNFVDVDHIDGMDSNLLSAYNEYQSWSREDSEWLSGNRQRIRLQIIYYRKIERKPVIELSDGRIIEYQSQNIAHVTAVAMGKVKLQMAQASTIIESWYAGPHHLGDKLCDAPYGMFPIVPFWGYRKDSSGEPYGLVADAIPAQDEVNFRRIRLTWLLQAKRVLMDEDATNMSDRAVQEEVERPDGLIKLNPDRRNQKSMSEVFQVQQDFNIASQQFSVMQESMKLIQDAMGVYSSFLGQDGGQKSGVAIANLVEQGATTLAEINDNYRFACQLVGELILGYILNDMKGRRNYKLIINRDDKSKRKPIVINEETEQGLNNDVTRLRAHIALAPIQQTTAYKSQLAERMMQITSQLPPEVQSAVIDLVLELSDIPNKSEFMDRIRKALGVEKDLEDMTPEEQKVASEQHQQELVQQELMMRELSARVSKIEAEAQRVATLAEKERAMTDSQRYTNAKTQAETGKILTEMEKINQEVVQIKQDLLANLQQQIDTIANNK
ncbi:portal protein [Photobacterium damselae subsp. damselae]|uniref:portal protein n=1 Tax=Photobacterium damselae TaxID=38293 RepID=UPI001F3FFD6B|nr:portal protein [Photobacterium damselae]UKA08696.1 portal protein [Photobacterium damselae subsp. damselae]UKA22910.1 portal protein [Photobacterium damselae subsp. damselae]